MFVSPHIITLSNCCPFVLIMSGKDHKSADEEPKYKKWREMMSIFNNNGGAGEAVQWSGHCHKHMLLLC